MGVSFFLVAGRELKKPVEDQIEWPELAVVRVAGKLDVDTVFLHVGKHLGVMVEEHQRFFGIYASEELREAFAVMSESGGGDIIAAGQGDACDLDHFVLEQSDIMLPQVFAGPLYAAYVLMVACHAIDAIGRSESAQIAPEIPTDDRIELAVHDIAREQYEVRLEGIYLFHDPVDMADAIRGSEMDIAGDREREPLCHPVFFLDDDGIGPDDRISGIDVPQDDSHECDGDCDPGCMIADDVYLALGKPAHEPVETEEEIVDDADTEEVDDPDEPERTESDQEIGNPRAPPMLYHLADDIGKRESDEEHAVYDPRDAEIRYHIPAVQKDVSVHESVEDEEYAEKQEKIGMTHDVQIKRERKKKEWTTIYSLNYF